MLACQQVEGDQVLLGLFEQPADLRRDRLEALEHVPDPLARVGLVFGVEHLAQGGGDQPALIAAAVGEHVSDEVHRAPLPRAGEHAGDGVLEPLVLIGDRQPHAAQPALLQARRNSIQKLPDSTSPMSRPMTSRTPVSCTA